MSIKLGTSLPQNAKFVIGRDVPVVARAAEQTGYDSVWVLERALFRVPSPDRQGCYGVPGLEWPEFYLGIADPIVTLTLAGAVTERVRVGTSILVAGLHQPFNVAMQFSALDNATNGRAVAGFGTGWSTDEFAAAGVVPFEKRGEALDEILDVTAAAWGPDPVSYQGKLVTVNPSYILPKPVSRIPVLLAAHPGSKAAMRRVAERADGWMPVVGGVDALAAGWAQVQDAAATAGRERPIEIVGRVNAVYSAKPFEGEGRQPFQGNAEQIAQDLVAHAAVAPLSEVILDLTLAITDAQELVNAQAEVFAAVRAAGL